MKTYQIIGSSIFGTCRLTPDGRAFDSEFGSSDPAAYTDGRSGSLALALMMHYGAEPNCKIKTEYGVIDVYQTPVHNGLIVCVCTYIGGAYSISPLFDNTVSPLAIVNHFDNVRKQF